VAEVAGAVGEENVYFVEVAVVEGRRHCSLGTVVKVVERSGCSPPAGSRVTIVEQESQEMLAEVVGRKLFCERHATRNRLCSRRTCPAVWGCWLTCQ
jgi:hypothetical protein